jgi:hypothetical protein
MRLSAQLLADPIARSPTALARVETAMRRLPNVLETQGVAHQKTLEQKISEQGPKGQQVDPHLLGLAIRELHQHRRIVNRHTHEQTNTHWFANARTSQATVTKHLEILAPLYSQVSQGEFKNRVGDALEIVTQQAILQLQKSAPRHSFSGHFDLSAPLNRQGRVPKTEPPDNISGHRAKKLADFHLHGFDAGPLCIECKNYREWIYPSSSVVTELIEKATALSAIPVLIARRVHYSTIFNLLIPAGVIVHESYYQYYPPEEEELAAKVREKNLLGFTDVTASYEPAPRTIRFFKTELPGLVDEAAARFFANKSALSDYAAHKISLSELYVAIASPAARASGTYDLGDIPF